METIVRTDIKHTLNLLIVDDDDVDRERLIRMLSKSDIDINISEASSVEDSMLYLDNNEYDCVIIDYRLGTNSGLTLLNNIRSRMGKLCAVIMITGLGDEEVAAEAMRLGASDYLLKSLLEGAQLTQAILNSIHRAELEQKMHDMAHYDDLTGLENRPLFLKNLQKTINNEENAAVAFLDLDNFKPVNDHYGHDTGDFVLITIANRLRQVLTKEDTCARIGGDEFILLLQNVSNKKVCLERLNCLIKLINTPIKLDKFDCHTQVSASVGVTLLTDEHLDADTILRRADQAMYQAKNMGNSILFFNIEEERRQQQHKAILQAAEQGILNDEFVLHYQPQIDMIDQKLIGVEALIRWNHPTLGFLYPCEFMEALNHPTIGVLIGEWVLQEALQQYALWRQNDLVISVNIAPAHLLNNNFVERLDSFLQTTSNVDPKSLQLEVLETVSMCEINRAVEVAEGCCKLGVSIALDDFGTGYASLNYLKKLPLNTLKIDRSFVKNILSDKEDRSIIRCIVALSKEFKYNLIAEGVESEEHEQALIDIGCTIGQGFFIAKPMATDKMTIWMEEYTQQ
jgi:diguanylate cyclase (GGDEF)-like protein